MRLRFKIDQGQFFCQIIFSQIILKRKPEENLLSNVLGETHEEGEGESVEAGGTCSSASALIYSEL